MAYCGQCGSCASYCGSTNVFNPFADGYCSVRQIEVCPSRSADDCLYYRPDNNKEDDYDEDNNW